MVKIKQLSDGKYRFYSVYEDLIFGPVFKNYARIIEFKDYYDGDIRLLGFDNECWKNALNKTIKNKQY